MRSDKPPAESERLTLILRGPSPTAALALELVPFRLNHLVLSERDSEMVAKLLKRPPQPNVRLRNAIAQLPGAV